VKSAALHIAAGSIRLYS